MCEVHGTQEHAFFAFFVSTESAEAVTHAPELQNGCKNIACIEGHPGVSAPETRGARNMPIGAGGSSLTAKRTATKPTLKPRPFLDVCLGVVIIAAAGVRGHTRPLAFRSEIFWVNFRTRDWDAGATVSSGGGVGVVRGGFFLFEFFCELTVAVWVHPRTCALAFRPHTILLSVGLRGLSAGAPVSRGGGFWVPRGVFFVRLDVLNLN